MQTENKKVLLSIRDEKQYFPIKKTSFREEQKYVKANDVGMRKVYIWTYHFTALSADARRHSL